MPRRKWTTAEEKLLVKMREEDGATFDEIAEEIGCSPTTVSEKYSMISETGVRAERASKAKHDFEALSSSVSAARCRREEHALATGDVTAVFFGDPLPGRSALDRMRARQ